MAFWPTNLIAPEIPLKPRERRAVYAGAFRRWMAGPTNRWLYGGALGACLIIFMVLPQAIDRLFGYHAWYLTVAGFVIYLAVLALAARLLQRWHFAPCVFAELRAQGIDVCSRCGFWLRGLGAGECPECGDDRPRNVGPGV